MNNWLNNDILSLLIEYIDDIQMLYNFKHICRITYKYANYIIKPHHIRNLSDIVYLNSFKYYINSAFIFCNKCYQCKLSNPLLVNSFILIIDKSINYEKNKDIKKLNRRGEDFSSLFPFLKNLMFNII
jgi:hypothetical protein